MNFGSDRQPKDPGVILSPSLPAVVIELLQTMDQKPHVLAEKLSRDQAPSAKVLRVHLFYGMSGKAI